MSMDYIRNHYGVPAKRGGRIKFGNDLGTIVGSVDCHLRVRLDGAKRSIRIHAVWEVTYLDPQNAIVPYLCR
jgi:hypothetical protein